MANKQKAWRAAGKQNTIEGEFSARQITAWIRSNPTPSVLLTNLLARGAQ